MCDNDRFADAFNFLIAAQGLTRNAIVITHNTGEFSRVLGLEVEDWVL